ncbi:hypothetical protein QQF64_000274 [Cirrhinus molitorella]|uniref:Uncharacterized protein n=1 Tax=Cirrhinus molitorella TaxID=172907 RepID=A0ABR3NWU7_9TELE
MDTKKVMTEALEDLVDEELKQFIRQLCSGVKPDIEPISQAKFQTSEREDVVDCMLQQYPEDAGEIAVQALRNMEQNELAQRLELKLQEVQQHVQEEARNASVSMELQAIQSEWHRPDSITPCSQRFKDRLLTEEKNEARYRDGAEIDQSNMEWLLRALGYSVEKHTNLSGEAINRAVKSFSKRYEHQNADSTFVVIMSHGDRIDNKDAILGVHFDDRKNPSDYFFVEDIFSHLNSVNCPALIDKPKVILIHSCRGGEDGGVYVSDNECESDAYVHKEKDFVCFMSSLPDVCAYRNSVKGSYFFYYIVDVFSRSAHKYDIMELFRKEADNVYDMFRTRYTLHRQAYQHKIANIIEDMLSEALLLADRDLHVGKEKKDKLKISEAIKTAEDYSKLTDEIFEQILSSTSPNLEKARDILNKIVRRKLPKFVGEARLTKKNISKEELAKTWKAEIEKYNQVPLNAADFRVCVVDLDHGMKNENPIKKVYFYTKRNHDKASPIEDYQVSSFLPEHFSEVLVRVYCDTTDREVVEEAEKCFKAWYKSNFGLPSNIIFYEDKYFQGEQYNCSDACPNLQESKLKSCSSIYVESGTWLLYEQSNYNGMPHILTRGEYPNYQFWKSPEDLCSIKMHSSTECMFKIQLYEKEDFEGLFHETTVHCPSVVKRFGIQGIRSCKVISGVWTLHEGSDYSGNHYQLKEGEYRKPESWNNGTSTASALSVNCLDINLDL